MMRLVHRYLSLITLLSMGTPGPARAQGDARQLLQEALAQLNAHTLDSAETLVRLVLNDSRKRNLDEYAAALMLRGVIEYYRLRDSAASEAFVEALTALPTLRGDWLFRADSTLWALWRRDQSRVICGASDLPTVVLPTWPNTTPPPPELTRVPRIVRDPRITYPVRLRQQGVEGHVIAGVVVDSAGRVSSDSITIVQSSQEAFSAEVRWYLRHARFEPARFGDHAVQACVGVTVDFQIIGR